MGTKKVKKYPYVGRAGSARDFIRIVHELREDRSYREIFEDFLELSYCALAKTAALSLEDADALERRYMKVAGTRDRAFIEAMPELLALAATALNDPDGCDFLGDVAADLGTLNGEAGQFFTPFEVSKMMATIILGDAGRTIDAKGYITIDEPTAGAGGVILAAASILGHGGHDASRQMFVRATDISLTAFKMCYVQLALRDIPAMVVHGDTLRLSVWDRRYTPAFFPFAALQGSNFASWLRGDAEAEQSPELLDDAMPAL